MKWFPFILALYFLGLSLITCTDGNVRPISENNQEIFLSAETQACQDHIPHQDSTDDCSPLCTCHCCHVHITLTDVAIIRSTPNDHSCTPIYLNNFEDSGHFDFFIPPQA